MHSKIGRKTCRKIEEITKLGFDPYAHKFDRNTNISEIVKKYDKLKKDEKDEKAKLSIAGRIRSVRGHGKLHFIDLEDFSGRLQLYIDAKNLNEKQNKLVDVLHPGDIIGVSGAMGKMGKRIIHLAKQEEGLEVVFGLEKEGHPGIGSEFEGVKITDNLDEIKNCDCLIDFSSPEATMEHLGYLQE